MQLIAFQVSSELLEDETCVVSVAGELDLYTVPELERALLAADGARAVAVELSECTFVDSTALGVLIAAQRRLRRRGGTLSIVGAAAEIRRPFELTGLDRQFAFRPSS